MKISIIGSGNVGSSLAYVLSMSDFCKELVLIDLDDRKSQGRVIDLMQSSLVFGKKIDIKGGSNYDLISDSDIVVITAGLPRKQGQNRQDLLLQNALIVKNVSENISKFAPNSIILVITNPLDEMLWVAYHYSGFDKKRVIGMSGELDSARLMYELFQNKEDFGNYAKVMGPHSDKMIISQNNISKKIENLDKICREVVFGGQKIINLTGMSAYYAPAAACFKMCELIFNDKQEQISASVILDNYLACGRLVSLGRGGIVDVFSLNLNAFELEQLSKAENEIRKNIKLISEEL